MTAEWKKKHYNECNIITCLHKQRVLKMQLGCINNSNLIGYEVYEEVGIKRCWRNIEAAWCLVPDLSSYMLT